MRDYPKATEKSGQSGERGPGPAGAEADWVEVRFLDAGETGAGDEPLTMIPPVAGRNRGRAGGRARWRRRRCPRHAARLLPVAARGRACEDLKALGRRWQHARGG